LQEKSKEGISAAKKKVATRKNYGSTKGRRTARMVVRVNKLLASLAFVLCARATITQKIREKMGSVLRNMFSVVS
jgi:ABC-type transport system involved in Fe-S cluster assembly fused permease/ATPase subunit